MKVLHKFVQQFRISLFERRPIRLRETIAKKPTTSSGGTSWLRFYAGGFAAAS